MKQVKILTHSSIYQVPNVHKDGKNCEYNSKYEKQSTLKGANEVMGAYSEFKIKVYSYYNFLVFK